MRIRKPKTQKFYLDQSREMYFELKTIPSSVTQGAISSSTQQTLSQPTTTAGLKLLKAKESIEVKQKTDINAIIKAELKYALVSFILPGEGEDLESSHDKDGKRILTQDQMVDKFDYLDDDLEFYVGQAMDIMKGNFPDEKDMERLGTMGITVDLMGVSDAEVRFPVEDPLADGGSA